VNGPFSRDGRDDARCVAMENGVLDCLINEPKHSGVKVTSLNHPPILPRTRRPARRRGGAARFN
jgi:hypothetical protein